MAAKTSTAIDAGCRSHERADAWRVREDPDVASGLASRAGKAADGVDHEAPWA